MESASLGVSGREVREAARAKRGSWTRGSTPRFDPLTDRTKKHARLSSISVLLGGGRGLGPPLAFNDAIVVAKLVRLG